MIFPRVWLRHKHVAAAEATHKHYHACFAWHPWHQTCFCMNWPIMAWTSQTLSTYFPNKSIYLLVVHLPQKKTFWNQEGQILLYFPVDLDFTLFFLARAVAFGFPVLDFGAGVFFGGGSATATCTFTFFRMVLGCSGSKDSSGYLGKGRSEMLNWKNV